MQLHNNKQTWRDNVKNVYASIEELEDYDGIYGVAKRCGFKSAAKMWEENPMIGGSTDPKDFGLAKYK